MSKYQGTAIACALLLSLISTTSQAEFRRSLIQKAENPIYIALGGGAGGMNTGSWDASRAVDPAFPNIEENQPNNKTVGTANGMFAIGYGFDPVPVRLEIAYNYIGNGKFEWDNLITPGITGIDLQANTTVFANTLMLNGYLDFVLNDVWLPYVMIGGGYGINSAKLEYTVEIAGDEPADFTETSDRVNKSNFVWNIGVGLNYALSESWTVGLAGTYFYLGKMDVDAFDVNLEEDVHVFSVDRLDAFLATANVAYHF